ncbi:MAG: ABC transporter ATP-binding protein [Desulfovibrio sp.]|nr:ABC transporter ATP-binding protein [Desulfovibrio sp.]
MSEPLLRLANLRFAYGSRLVLAGVDLELFAAERVALTGANGSGKTTLFRCITGLEKAQAGEIVFAGCKTRTEKDFQALRRRLGYAVQNAEDQLIFPTVLEDICFGPLNLGLTEEAAQARALAQLAELGLAGFDQRLTHQLSGGQQKLAAMAAVLVMRPEVLLLDEPFNGLDDAACERLCAVLDGLGCGMIVVSHETQWLDRLCNRRLLLANGRLVRQDVR